MHGSTPRQAVSMLVLALEIHEWNPSLHSCPSVPPPLPMTVYARFLQLYLSHVSIDMASANFTLLFDVSLILNS